jgi:hypothetical protein
VVLQQHATAQQQNSINRNTSFNCLIYHSTTHLHNQQSFFPPQLQLKASLLTAAA